MNLGAGEIAWAAMMAALVIAYLGGMNRADGLHKKQMLKMAMIWAAIITAAYFLVRLVTGIN
ncbi:hypothetical protein [Qipengyuania sp. 483]